MSRCCRFTDVKGNIAAVYLLVVGYRFDDPESSRITQSKEYVGQRNLIFGRMQRRTHRRMIKEKLCESHCSLICEQLI